jgi:PKD repeat protein
MRLINNKVMSLSMLMVLCASLTAVAGKQTPNNGLAKESKVKTSKQTTSVKQKIFVKGNTLAKSLLKSRDANPSRVSAANQVCAIDENGQDWEKLQKKLSKELKQRSLFSAKSTKSLARSRMTSTTTFAATVQDNGVAGRYYIPVVFHVYGEMFTCDDATKSCLTDAKIIDALQRLNEDFQGTNTQDGLISPQFQAIRDNLNVEFVLAKKSPSGADSNGIVRYDREQAGYGNGSGADDLIAADAWDNLKYMNVYIMNDLYDDGDTNNSGVAWYPDLSMTQANTSRVVYNGWYVGDNTDENFRSVLTHEFGHWLNLPHTFAGNSCSLANETFCGLTGDRSCDTPQMSLSTDMYENSKNCLGQPTNTENFMHYTSNYAMFTEHQVARMTAALHGDARSSLWSNDNLMATGLTDFTSNADHPWDGISGVDNGPTGELITSFDNLSAEKDAIDTYVVDAPAGTEALAFYLSGYSQDPDMYVSVGQESTLLTDGTWKADYISFLSTATPEFIGVLGPKATDSYYATVHAFSAYDQANLEVLSVEDPLLAEGSKRYHVIKQGGLWSAAGAAPKKYQFTIPDAAEKVVIVFAGAYGGDPDMYVSRNKAVDTESADCAPFSASKLAEYCEFAQGGTFNILIDPFAEYWDGELHVYYETSDDSNQPPFANTAPNHQAMLDHEVHFKGDSSTDVDGSIVSYLWDFGNGDSSTETNPVYVYNQLGQYDASLTVIDDMGVSSTTNTLVDITLYNPNDAVLCDGCSRVYLTEEIGLSADKGSEPRTYKYSVPTAASLVVIEIVAGSNGDPDLHVSQNKAVSIESFTCRPWEGPGALETCQFSEGGIFNVMIDPFDAYSDVTYKAYYDIRDDADHSMPNELPIAQAGSNYTAFTGNALTLSSAGSIDEDGQIVSYLWDLGDGNTSDLENPAHSYAEVGQYNISLTVTDNEGATATAIATVIVNPAGDMDGDGDVDRDDMRALSLAVRRGEQLDLAFDINGDGVVNSRDVRAMRSICSYERCSTISPPPEPPTAMASSNDNVEQFATITFSSAGSNDNYGRIVSYSWNFGDGTSSSLANPSHEYQQVGSYNVILTVTDNDGMTATDTIALNVNYGALVNSCANQPTFEEGTLEAGNVICLGTEQGRAFALPEMYSHNSVAITVAHGAGDLSLYYRNGGWVNVNNGGFDASSTEANNQACIYLELNDELDYWSYIELAGATSGATMVVDFDTQGCRPVQ